VNKLALQAGSGLLVCVCCNNPSGPAGAAPDAPSAPPAIATSTPSSPAVDTPPPAESRAIAPAKYAPIPNWTYNGSDPATGDMVLRCENAFPPEDGSGKCKCEGYELDVCVDGARSLVIDRKQCGFICKPTPQDAKKIALRCPDGTNPEASAKGCACSGRQPFDPCAGGIASATLTAGECVVTCKKKQ